MSTLKKLLILFFLVAFTLAIDENLTSSCSGIDHCVTCHSGYIFYVCDQCDSGYGVDTKYDGSDLCIFCDSVIPHCLECSNPEDAWNCGKCAPGYKLVTIQFQDDMCVQESSSGIEEGSQFLA
jgi:hypothetical protein